jgi:Family of unknown function (DUF6364)
MARQGETPNSVDITCSTLYPVAMAKRNLTIQLDEATIRHAKIVAAHRGMSLSGLVAQQLNELAEADERYERARAVALEALVGASGGGTPVWHREELYDL